MPGIEQEIDQVANELEKSNKTAKEQLFDTIRQLGPAGIRARMGTLEKSERELLLGALTEMKKGGSKNSESASHGMGHASKPKPSHKDMLDMDDYAHDRAQSEHRDAKYLAKNAGDHDAASYHHDMEGLHGRYKSHNRGQAGMMEQAEKEHASIDKAYGSGYGSMKKAVEMDKNYQAEYVQGKLKATIIQEDKADDDQDEKLVMPEAAVQHHQGTPAGAWEGQVIKGKKDMSKDSKIKEAKESPEDAEEVQLRAVKRMNKSVEILKKHGLAMLAMLDDDIEKAHVGFAAVSKEAAKHGADDPDAVAAAVGRKKYGKEGMAKLAEAGKKKDVKKSEEIEKAEGMYKKQGVPKGVDPEKWERGVKKVKNKPGVKNPYAIVNASMKKGEPITAEVKDALLEIRKSVEEQLKELGAEPTPELIKSEMKRLLKEEDQDGDAPEMNVKTRANKEDVEALDLAADNKKAQKKVDDEKQGQGGAIKKAVWGSENDLLKANTNGRNFHFSLEEHLAWLEVNKAGNTPEDLKKSVGEKKDDLNDIIAKSQDTTWGHVECDLMLKANSAKRGKVVKSFEDNEIAEALGLTPEQAKKLLGE